MKTLLPILMVLLSGLSFAQTGGNFSFPFLDLPFNARNSALGNSFITGYDKDVNMGVANPAMLNEKMRRTVSVNQALLSGGINFGMFNYGFGLKDKGTMVGYMKYVSYGKFDRTSVNGTSEGTFSPVEMIVGAGYGHTINERLSVGVNANIIYSALENYTAFGASVDFAGAYRNEEKGIVVTAMAKNIGAQFDAYVPGTQNGRLPLEIQAAVGYKVAHAPFRISVLAHHLNTWDLTYNDPNAQPTLDPLTGDSIPVPTAGFFEKFGRHFTYQLEGLFGKHLHVRAAFDYNRRKSLASTQRPGAAGFSFGLGLYFRRFSIDYGFMAYSHAGFNNILTLSSNLSEWRK